MEKSCTICLASKPIEDFGWKGKYRSSYCKPCETTKRLAHRRENGRNDCPIKAQLRYARYQEQDRKDRADNKRLGQFVLYDCRGSDRKRGRECDLDREFVDEMVAKPCSYCGLTAEMAKITLDRIDNSLGHLKSNVITSCYRCNLIRSDMPYDAWIMIVPAIKAAVEAGVFGEWKLRPRRKSVEPVDIASLEASIPTHPQETSAKGKYQKVSDEDYIKALKEHPTIGQALIALGLSPRGKNYTRAKRLLGYADDVRLNTNGKIRP